MTVDHYRWLSLDELMPVTLVQPGEPPTYEQLNAAIISLSNRVGAWNWPRIARWKLRNEIRVAAGLPVDTPTNRGHQGVKDRPDTWPAVIKFCDEYQISKPKVA